MKNLLLAFAVSLAVAACGTGLDRRDAEKLSYVDYAGEPVEQITVMGGVDGWTPISRNQLVIWDGANKGWLIKVWDNCPDLEFAMSIRVTQTGSTISRFEKVLAGRDACPISEIRPIDMARMKADRKAARDTTATP